MRHATAREDGGMNGKGKRYNGTQADTGLCTDYIEPTAQRRLSGDLQVLPMASLPQHTLPAPSRNHLAMFLPSVLTAL